MSTDSDPDEFYDAEDFQERSQRGHERKRSVPVKEVPTSLVPVSVAKDSEVILEARLKENVIVEEQTVTVDRRSSSPRCPERGGRVPGLVADEVENAKVREMERRRRKVEEARRRVQAEELDDAREYLGSIPSSPSSSADGVWAALRSSFCDRGSSNPDERSSVTISLGQVGSILGEKEEEDSVVVAPLPAASSPTVPTVTVTAAAAPETAQGLKLQEPDVVASAKNAIEQPPIAPPRRRRRKAAPEKPSVLSTCLDMKSPQGLPSPASTIESLTKEFEHSLDLPSAIRGQYVVKPQDEEKTKADGGPTANYVLCIGPVCEGDPSDSLGVTKQLNMVLRTRTDSGKQLTDMEILEQVTVLNLDTGERVPLSLAEDRLPKGVNPLSLHLMRLTSEYVSNSSLEKDESDDDVERGGKLKTETLSGSLDNVRIKKKTAQFKRLLNRTVEKTVSKIKSVADEVYHPKHGVDDMDSSEEEAASTDMRRVIKVKSSSSHKGACDFSNIKLVQDLSGEHSGAVWTMKFSYCGRLLASVGQDHILRIWVLKDYFDYFNDMQQKYNSEARLSPTPSQESLTSHHSTEEVISLHSQSIVSDEADDTVGVFSPKPFCKYEGHTADLLDVSWSKNYFILTSSMDKTVRLWHISRKECLCCFQHIDFVTAIAFHPKDDRYFLSGSLDGKLRLWNIPDKKVALWNELDGQTKLITSANFCQNGKFAVVGTYDGRCIFYTTEQLKYYTQIHVRSTRGKNATGRKISGIEPMPGEDKILVTSNDSRVRLYDLRDLSLSCKYKGYVNQSSQIRASFSHDGKYIATGSENHFIYLWKTRHDYAKFSSARKDRNDYWENVKVHNAVVTAAVFAPDPGIIFRQMEGKNVSEVKSSPVDYGYILVTADFSGCIKVFVNKIKSSVSKGIPN